MGMFSLFISLSLAGIIVNGTFLYAAVKERIYKASRRNVYIMNLAFSDLVIAIGIFFFPTLNYVIMDSIPFGQVSCKVFELVRDIVTPVTLISLSVLSRERYRAVFRATKQTDPNAAPARKASFLICYSLSGCNTVILVWLFSGMTLIPISLMGHLRDMPLEDVDNTEICMLDRFEYLEPKSLVLMRCFITYVTPILIIIYNYLMIAWKLFSWSAIMKRLFPRSGESCMTEKMIRTTKRIFLLAFLIIVLSAPCHCFGWIYFLGEDSVDFNTEFWKNWRMVGFYLFYLYPILNPVFFYLSSRKYKALFDTYLFRRKSRDSSPTQAQDDPCDEDEYVNAFFPSDESPVIRSPAIHTNGETRFSSPA